MQKKKLSWFFIIKVIKSYLVKIISKKVMHIVLPTLLKAYYEERSTNYTNEAFKSFLVFVN